MRPLLCRDLWLYFRDPYMTAIFLDGRIQKMTLKHVEPWRKTLYIIWTSQFITMMGMNLVVPFLPF